MRFSFLVALPLLLAATVAQAQRSATENIDASKLPDSGPLITGGSGATAGPNSKEPGGEPEAGPAGAEREAGRSPAAAAGATAAGPTGAPAAGAGHAVAMNGFRSYRQSTRSTEP